MYSSLCHRWHSIEEFRGWLWFALYVGARFLIDKLMFFLVWSPPATEGRWRQNFLTLSVPNLHENNEFVPLCKVLTHEWHTFPFFHWQQGNRPILELRISRFGVLTTEKLSPRCFHLPITGSGILGAASTWFFYYLTLCQFVCKR